VYYLWLDKRKASAGMIKKDGLQVKAFLPWYRHVCKTESGVEPARIQCIWNEISKK
jgi:hypothetical protein